MEQGKRPLEGGAQREAKKQQTENTLVFGEISLPEGPAVDFKERLAKPLGKAMIIVGGGASSQQHRLTVKKVMASRIKSHVVKYLSKMPSYEMLLPPFVPRATPIQSEAIANADMQTNLFDLVNYVFRQLRDDSGFYKQYAILMNPLKRDTKALTDALKAIWHHSGSSGAKGNRPDNLLLRTWNAEGFYEAQPDSLYSFEGKQLDVFSQYFDDEEVESGNLELADNWEELGVHAKNAVGQLAQYLVDDGLERGILYTRNVLWEVRVTNPDEKNLGVSISEPVTATDTKPSMAEVVFACVHEQMDSVRRERLEVTGASAAKASSASKEPQSGGFGEESDASGQETTTEGPMSSDVEIVQPCRFATKGDKLLCDLDDSEPALCGNSVVRIGRVNGVKVAAKMVLADEDAWVRDEIENESRCLEALRSLQGSAIVEKLFASTINQGKDRLLVTKFVEGTRLDKAEITEDVAASARSALGEIHKKGYIHGDVTSRNIIVQPSGKCVFVDLGRAKLVKAESDKRTEMLELEAEIKSCFRRAKRHGCV